MGQRVPAYRFPERALRPVARTPCAPSKRQPPESSSTEASVAISCPYATIANGYLGRPILGKRMGPIAVPKFTGTPELALGPRPPDTTLTRWLYEELRRAMFTGRHPVMNTNASSATNRFARASPTPLLPPVMTENFTPSAGIF